MRMRPVVALAAGGTGGHVFPAEALAGELLQRFVMPVLFTDQRGEGFGGGIDVCRVRGGALAGVGGAARILGLARLALGFADALLLLRQRRPDVVVGFGGYASVPTLLAASVLGIPTVIHEQNAVLGRANRLLAGRVGRIATAFADTTLIPAAAAGKVVRVGMPVRPGIAALAGDRYTPPAAGEPVHLLVLGGSQGAQVFSALVPDAIARLPEALRQRLRVVQQCRPETLAATQAAYARLGVAAQLSAFFADVAERLAAAHIVIARSGASTVAELAVIGRPAILLPYPHATDDHQTRNAQAMAAAGGGWLLVQHETDAARLAGLVSELLAGPEALAAAAEAARAVGVADAARRLADLAVSLVPVTGGAPQTLPRQGAA
jgi:UDP-N-acetylglucosamine--N-acetylmuramyl-(pentapeptide) pyrophosphoryl-undecaprenol N-acetylglucosamine transferase